MGARPGDFRSGQIKGGSTKPAEGRSRCAGSASDFCMNDTPNVLSRLGGASFAPHHRARLTELGGVVPGKLRTDLRANLSDFGAPARSISNCYSLLLRIRNWVAQNVRTVREIHLYMFVFKSMSNVCHTCRPRCGKARLGFAVEHVEAVAHWKTQPQH